jgi:hypothetical protein
MTAPRRARARTHEPRRLPAVAGVVLAVGAVVAAGVTVDRRGAAVDPAETTSTTLLAADLAPTAPAGDALASTWYCAAGTARDGGSADHRVVIVNPGDVALDATLTVYGGGLVGDPSATSPEPEVEAVEIPPRGRVAVRLADVLEAQFASALVEVVGGEVVVEHVVRGAEDLDAAPCSTTPSATWHAASGRTTRDARELLVLFNPFPDDAVVDVRFVTPDGLRTDIPALTGFVVRARSVVAVDVGDAVERHEQVALTVQTRAGRLVVDRLQSFDGSTGPSGLSLTPLAPAAALVWQFPDGYKAEGITEVVTVYNPSDTQAELDVELVVDPSSDPAIVTGIEPFQVSVAPGRYAQVVISAEERVPADLGHAVVVRSQNGVPVVAERSITSVDPAPRTGFSSTLGSPIVADRWLTAVGGTGDEESEFLVVLNPSLDTIARISIATPAPTQLLEIEGLQDLEVQPGTRLRIDLGEHVNRDTLPLVIQSTQPVVVERGMYPAVGGIAQSVPVASGRTSVAVVDTGSVDLGG